MPAICNAEATSEEQIRMLPFPLLVSCAITLASLSTWNIKPLIFSTDHLPFESVSKSKVPEVVVFVLTPFFSLFRKLF